MSAASNQDKPGLTWLVENTWSVWSLTNPPDYSEYPERDRLNCQRRIVCRYVDDDGHLYYFSLQHGPQYEASRLVPAAELGAKPVARLVPITFAGWTTTTPTR